jgi:hypothetical protein
LLDQLKDELGVSYIFDGVMLFLTKHVGDIELQARARDDSVVRVILNLTKKLDHPTLQVSNLMFIKARTLPLHAMAIEDDNTHIYIYTHTHTHTHTTHNPYHTHTHTHTYLRARRFCAC